MDEFRTINNWNKYIPTIPKQFDDKNGTELPILDTSHIFWVIMDSSLMIIILSGNILTICAVHYSRKLSRTIANQFILSLAFSDFLVGLTLPYHLAFYLGDTLGKEKLTCLLRFVLISMACSASIYNLIAIAVDRYIAIVYPLHYNRYMTKNMAIFIIICGWVISTIVSTLPVYWNRWDDSHQQECELHVIIPKYFVIFVMVPYFSIVWATLFILYVRIWREAVDHAKRLRTTNYYQNGFHKRDWKSIQVVLLVLGCFSICWLPYLIVACFEVTENPTKIPESSTTIYKTAFSLAMVNSGMNPIIYAWKNTGFRTAFIRLLHCQNPDSSEYNPSHRNKCVQNNSSINSQKMVNGHAPSTMDLNNLQLPTITTSTTLNVDFKICENNTKGNGEMATVSPQHAGQSTELVLHTNGLRHNNSTFTIITADGDLEETVT